MNSAIRQLVRMIFLIRRLVRIVLVICFVSCPQLPSPFVSALTKYTPLFLINGSCPSPNLKKDFFAKCVSTPCSHPQATYTQDRLRRVHHMKIIPFRLTTNSQPDLSLSVFLERVFRWRLWGKSHHQTVPVWSSQNHLGHVDRGSAVDDHQSIFTLSATILGSSLRH